MKEQKKDILNTFKTSQKFGWPLVGNQHIIDFLSKSIINEKVGHSYIFLGPDNLGKTTLANHFARILLCQRQKKTLACGQCDSCRQFKSPTKDSGRDKPDIRHSDFYLIKKELDKKNISIEQIREFIRSLSMSSFLNSYKIGVIKNAESLSQEAANALLKTLEEPKDKVVIILIAVNLESIPLTIVSRSQVLNFLPAKTDIIYDFLIKEHRASRSEAKNFSRLSLGRPALAVKFLEDKDFRNDYIKKAEIFIQFFRQDVNERLDQVSQIIGSAKAGQESVKTVFKVIEAWQGLVRDLLLLDFNNDHLMQHEIFRKDFAGLKARLTPGRLLGLMKFFQEAKDCLRANVNPKLVLENIVINI